MTKKSKSYLALTFIFIAAVFYLLMSSERNNSSSAVGLTGGNEVRSAPSMNTRTPAATVKVSSDGSQETDKKSLEQVATNFSSSMPTSNGTAENSNDAVFQLLLSKNPDMKRLWEATLPIGVSEHAVMARKWIAMGLVIAPDQAESKILDELIREMNRDPQAVFSLIDQQDPLIQQDPFIEQVALSLVHILKVEPAQKAAFYAKTIERNYEFGGDGKVSIQVANSTNAFIYLRESRMRGFRTHC